MKKNIDYIDDSRYYDGYYDDVEPDEEIEYETKIDKSMYIKVGIAVFFGILVVGLAVITMNLF